MSEEDWVSVHISASRAEADLQASLLRAEGISVLVRGADFLMDAQQVFPEIVVPRGMASRAQDILDAASRTDEEAAAPKRADPPRGGPMLPFVAGVALGVFVMLVIASRSGRTPTRGSDVDGDGRADRWDVYRDGVLVERRWSTRRDGVVDKKEMFRNGVLTEQRFDLDGDGVFEVRKTAP